MHAMLGYFVAYLFSLILKHFVVTDILIHKKCLYHVLICQASTKAKLNTILVRVSYKFDLEFKFNLYFSLNIFIPLTH